MSNEMQPYEPSYLLLKESREFWDYVVSDKLVYSLDSREITLNSCVNVSKRYLKGDVWIEGHLTFEAEGNTHYTYFACTVESQKGLQGLRQPEENLVAMHGNPSVLVDDAQEIKTPEQVCLDRGGIPSVIRLKRVDDLHCFCGYTAREALEFLGTGLFKDRELGVLGVLNCQTGKAPYELIQGGAETVEKVSCNERDGVRNVINLNANAIPLIFNVILKGDKGVGFRFVENVQLLPQVIKVYFRPYGFKIGVGQVRHEKSPVGVELIA